MKKSYKVIIILLVIYVLFLASGCNGVESDLKGIKNLVQQEMYTQKEDKYLVFIYRESCPDCENVKASVLEYISARKKNSSSRKIYGFNLSNEKNDGIYRIRAEGDGRGQITDSTGVLRTGAFYVDGLTKWSDLYIAGTAALISIKEKDGVRYSYFVCSGAEKIKNYLNEELNR